MAAYTTEAIVRAQSPFKNTANIDTTYIARKIAEADSIINATIGSTYSLPLSSVPEIISSLSAEIATLLIIREQNLNIEVQPGVNLEEAWKTQMDILTAITERKIKLFDSNGIELTLSSDVLPHFYPDATSSDDSSEDSTAPKFTINQTF